MWIKGGELFQYDIIFFCDLDESIAITRNVDPQYHQILSKTTKYTAIYTAILASGFA